MISVMARDGERLAVREFFELFKTPWKFHGPEDGCDVLLCAGVEPPKSGARLVLVYAAEPLQLEQAHKIQTRSWSPIRTFSYGGGRIPIYGRALTFNAAAAGGLKDELSREAAAVPLRAGNQTVVRVGYDLFQELQYLLTQGQPPAQAGLPAVERHIDWLRQLILSHSIPLVEIPPVPEGHKFIACLTHDVDHFGLRNYKFNRTTLGFLYRASLGSALDFCRGRKSLRQVGVNCRAALTLPLVHLGLARDFWRSFDRYLQIENGLSSTFFVVPMKNEPGQDASGRRIAKRAVRYDVGELAADLRKVRAAGHEVGVHGIDAWRDSERGRDEFERVAQVTGEGQLGVRMHWLYFDAHSPRVLEQAGFTYDSTVGYNDTIGYRAGTTQVFKPLQNQRMLELPMHIMDTALFYPSYLNLSPREATSKVEELQQRDLLQLGGVLTVNWHDRSIVPERLWDGFYVDLLDSLKAAGVWFASAAQTVAWFGKRRAIRFESVDCENGSLRVQAPGAADGSLPGLIIRVYTPVAGTWKMKDIPLNGQAEVTLAGAKP